ncbi:MAG: 50S ribosomal protein L24 [Clostridiales bacterium]|nr:50S ribosomal protein L24 [Clostridiales bacterium]
MNKLNVKKGDTVLVISGADKGKKGKILVSHPSKSRVVVQGVHMITRHVKPRRQGEAGGRIEQEGTIHVSNVKLICPECRMPTKAVHRMVERNGKTVSVRACSECKKTID